MDKRVIFNERLERWAKNNHCEIDDCGFLHVYKKDADMFKQSLLEADLKEWRNKLGHAYQEIRDARFA